MADSISIPELRERLAGAEPPIVLDVRREPAFAASPEVIAGAERRLPEAVDAWADELPAGCEVVAYCVLGQQMSQGVVARLAERGIRASFLEGGIEGWKAEGGALATAERQAPAEPADPSEDEKDSAREGK